MGPAQMFAAAQDALVAGRAEEAVRLLERLGRAVAPDPAISHMKALALKAAGKPAEALEAFQEARRLAPADPHIAGNFANLLAQLDRTDEALRLYDAAIARSPHHRDVRFNKALLLQRLERLDEALTLLDALCAANSADARAQAARGAVLRALGRHDEAADAFDAALAVQPQLATARAGRAQIALERGETGSPDLFRAALAVRPGDEALFHGLAESLEAEGRAGEAIALLRDALRARPEWADGHMLLARMLAEQGEDDFTSEMREAAERRPADRALRIALARTLARAERWGEALSVLEPLGDAPDIRSDRAYYLSEAGEAEAALRLLGSEQELPAPLLVTAARARLRLGDLDGAVAVLERAVALDPLSIPAWSQLELAWRASGHPRSGWLSETPGLWSTQTIDLSEAQLEQAAETLRALHRTNAHPIGQSLRGGTQTRGRLFLRGEPIIRALGEALSAAVQRHAAGLPPRDPGHPLLRYRDAPLSIAGSWSVRLTGGGFHVQHVHPEGVLSSACYIALPDSIGNAQTRDGWLELGRPPANLRLTLEPVATIEPRPGRLALFPSYLYHGTRPFGDGERLTVAFDVVAG